MAHSEEKPVWCHWRLPRPRCSPHHQHSRAVTRYIRWDDVTQSLSFVSPRWLSSQTFKARFPTLYLYHNDAIKPHDTNIKFRHPQIKYLISSWHFEKVGPSALSELPAYRTFSLQTWRAKYWICSLVGSEVPIQQIFVLITIKCSKFRCKSRGRATIFGGGGAFLRILDWQ